MPNWCQNTLIISHEDKDILDSLMAQVRAGDGNLFQYIKPMPSGLDDTVKGTGDEAQTTEYDGHTNWYDWRCENWSTKWDACNMDYSENDDTVQFTFDTAWSPPTGVYEALMEQGFQVEAYYIEWGCMFVGEWHSDSETYTDSHYNIGDDDIPPHLDDEFGITEQLQEWEDEENEDG